MALLQTGVEAPAFKGMNLTGPEFQMDNIKGKTPLVILFSPDQINPVQTKQTAGVYNQNKAEVEMVVMSRKLPSVAMAKAFLLSNGVKFPVVFDPKQDIYKLYGVEKPVVIFSVNKDGLISGVAEYDPKALTAAHLQEAIQKAKDHSGAA